MSVPDATRIPVIIGVGEVNDRPVDAADGLDSLGLMIAALRAAEADCGRPVLHRLGFLGVVDQLSFADPEIHHRVAKCFPRIPSRVVRTKDSSGDGPVRLINDAANLIASGELQIAAAVGAEAMRTANKRIQASPGGANGDRLAEAATAGALPDARPYGLLTPAEIYPLYEQATRAAWGLSLAEAQAETGHIWAEMSKVAAVNPHAWLREAVSAERIVEPGPDNRLISFPYTKLMIANSAVNQGAAVIVASLAVARELGISEEALVYVGRGAAAHEPDDYLRRDSFERSASMIAVLEQVLAANEVDINGIDNVELYSCFPCIPKMARRVLGWPTDKPMTVYGGLTFGGAPVGNCMMHATAAMVRQMRGTAQTGLIFANGGYASHNHAIVLTRSAAADADSPRSYDVQALAEAARSLAPRLISHCEGTATVESYVIPYNRRSEARFATIVARNSEGDRVLAHVPPDDAAVLALLTGGGLEPVGTRGMATAMDDGRTRWTC